MPICISFILNHFQPVLAIGLRDPMTDPGLYRLQTKKRARDNNDFGPIQKIIL